MDFPYESTFLRSAIVSDPYSLGDVGPEDVLRIESQFPYLFDSSHALLKQGGDNKAIRVGSKSNVTVAANKIKPKVTIDCFPKNMVRRTTVSSTELSSCNQSQLPPNVFCFSRDELKFMLEDVLRNNKLGNYTNPSQGTKRNLQRKQSHGSSQGLKNSASNSNQKFDYKGPQHLANRFALKEKKLAQKRFPISQEPAKMAPQEPYHNRSEKIIRSASFSAPGYLKKPLGPPLYRTKSALFRKNKKMVTFANKPETLYELQGDKVEATLESVPNSDLAKEVSGQCIGNGLDGFSSDSDSKKIEQIFVKGQGRILNAREDVHVSSDSEGSEILKLKLATSLADRYEKVGLLKKHTISIENDSYEEDIPLQAPEKFTSTSPRKKIKPRQSSNRKAFLEDLARELVYSEVLKHLQTVRIEHDESSEISSTSKSQSNKSIQATIISSLDEDNAVEIPTPQLSSNCDLNRTITIDEHPQDIPEKLSPPTPVTPILSTTFTLAGASSAKKTPKKSPHENNDVTDCSEISDFLASEVELKQPSIVEMEEEEDHGDDESVQSFATPNLTSTPKNNSYTSKASKSREDSKKSTSKFEVVTPEKSYVTSVSESTKLSSSVNGSEEKSKQESPESVKDSPVTPKSLTNTSPPTKTTSAKSNVSKQANSDKPVKVSFDISREIFFSEWIAEEVLGDKFRDSVKYRSPGEVSLSQCLSEENKSPARSLSTSEVSSHSKPSKKCSTGEVSCGEVS